MNFVFAANLGVFSYIIQIFFLQNSIVPYFLTFPHFSLSLHLFYIEKTVAACIQQTATATISPSLNTRRDFCGI